VALQILPTNAMCAFLFCPLRACSCDSSNTSVEQYKSWSSSLCSFLQSHFTLSLLGRGVFLSTPVASQDIPCSSDPTLQVTDFRMLASTVIQMTALRVRAPCIVVGLCRIFSETSIQKRHSTSCEDPVGRHWPATRFTAQRRWFYWLATAQFVGDV
jgi:hypothetical protein